MPPTNSMITIRNLVHSDIAAAIALQQRVYTAIPAFRHDQFERLLDRFPQGQFVAELNSRITGIAISQIIWWDDYSLHHTWASITNDGQFDTHDPVRGRTLYGAEVCVDIDERGHGIGHAL